MSGILQALLASLAAKKQQTLFTWGLGTYGRLGTGNVISRSSPVQIGSPDLWNSVAFGNDHALALTESPGKLFAWGRSINGRLGNNTGYGVNSSSPIQIGALTNWSIVACGASNSFAIKSDNTLWSWGNNSEGQLGDNTIISRSSPVQIGTTEWSSLFTGSGQHTLAIKTTGSLWAWGYNRDGQLGIGIAYPPVSNRYRSSPIQVGALTSWSSVSVGNKHTVARRTNGTLWAWGLNATGQLGVGSIANTSSPVQIGALTTWSTAIAAGGYSSFAIRTAGSLWAWGRDSYGALGLNTANVDKSSPVQVGANTNWAQVSTSQRSSAARTTGKTIFIWGGNTYGQIGDGTRVDKSSPVQVGASTWVYVVASRQATSAISE